MIGQHSMLSIFTFGLVILSVLRHHHLLLLPWIFMIHICSGINISCDAWSHLFCIEIIWGSIILFLPLSYWWDHLRYKTIFEWMLNLNYVQMSHVSFSYTDHCHIADDYFKWFGGNSLNCYWRFTCYRRGPSPTLDTWAIHIFRVIHETTIIDYAC